MNGTKWKERCKIITSSYHLLIYFQIPVHKVYIIKIYKYVTHVTMLLYLDEVSEAHKLSNVHNL